MFSLIIKQIGISKAVKRIKTKEIPSKPNSIVHKRSNSWMNWKCGIFGLKQINIAVATNKFNTIVIKPTTLELHISPFSGTIKEINIPVIGIINNHNNNKYKEN